MEIDSREELLDVLKKQVLADKRHRLVKGNLTRYLPYLKSKYVISMEDQEEIEALTTNRKKNDKIVDILLMRTAKAYDHLCEAILELEVEADLVIELNALLELKRNAVFKTNTIQLQQMDYSDLPKPSSATKA